MPPAQDASLSGCTCHTDPWALAGRFVTEPSLCLGLLGLVETGNKLMLPSLILHPLCLQWLQQFGFSAVKFCRKIRVVDSSD